MNLYRVICIYEERNMAYVELYLQMKSFILISMHMEMKKKLVRRMQSDCINTRERGN